MVPDSLRDQIEEVTGHSVTATSAVGGGCIGNATRLTLGDDIVFLKWARGEAGQTFEAEKKGLEHLRQSGSSLHIPDPIHARNAAAGSPGFILMEWIQEGDRAADFSTRLGKGLARLHRSEGPYYGFEIDNFIGRKPQLNTRADDWVDFFVERRLVYQVELARQCGRWQAGWDQQFDALCETVGDILPADPPASIVHGDLWSGNVIADSSGYPVIIDPAVYFGHREVDLAMTRLFGGFSTSFYDAYEDEWGLDPGAQDRWAIYNLYHLINHLNHFGSAYSGQVAATLRRFG